MQLREWRALHRKKQLEENQVRVEYDELPFGHVGFEIILEFTNDISIVQVNTHKLWREVKAAGRN